MSDDEGADEPTDEPTVLELETVNSPTTGIPETRHIQFEDMGYKRVASFDWNHESRTYRLDKYHRPTDNIFMSDGGVRFNQTEVERIMWAADRIRETHQAETIESIDLFVGTGDLR